MATTADTGLLGKLFELRMIVAVLFGIYGIVCLIWGLAFTTAVDLKKAAGINLNLVAGIGMLIVAVAFGAWALLKPLVPDEQAGTREQRTAGEQV